MTCIWQMRKKWITEEWAVALSGISLFYTITLSASILCPAPESWWACWPTSTKCLGSSESQRDSVPGNGCCSVERVTGRWHLCLLSGHLPSPGGGGGLGAGAFLREGGRGAVVSTGSRRGLFQWQVIGRGSHKAFFCLFVYTYISHGITILGFNDVWGMVPKMENIHLNF